MRGKVSKIAMFMLVLCMTVSMFAVDAFAADATTPIDSCNRIVEAYDLDDAEDYINDNNASTYPTCKTDGYIFAGWYTKETCTEDSFWGEEEPGDTVYALFVPSHVLGVKAQISSNLLDKNTSDDDTASIRFVTTVDSLLYRQAGFEISYVGTDGQTKNATSASNKVYKKLYAIGSNSEEYKEDDVLEYTPEGSFCRLSTYFKACTVSKIGSEFFSTAFTVKPYVITMDGSKVYGETVVKSINDYFLAEEVWVSSTDANRADTVENGTEAKPFETLNYALGMIKNGGTVHVKDSYVAPSDFAWKDHDKTVTITGGTIDFTSVSEVAINDSVTFTSTTLTFVNGQYIYANGNKVEIAESVTWGDASAYVCIYGGAYKTALKSDTNLVLGAGYYKRVYGGGNAGSVTGDVNVTLSGKINTGINYANHTLTYAAFGGGENGCTVKGDINFTIADSSVLFDYVYGGGYGSSVTGDITVNFSGKSMTVYGGCRNGSVTGDTYLIMTGANAWVEQLFGGCQASTATVVSNVYGNTNVDVQDGTVVRRVYGGCYNDAENKIFTLSWTSSYKVTGHTNVSISPNATFSLNYSELDNSIYAISRFEEVMADEWGAFIFNADSYTNTYKSKLGYNDSMYSSSFSSQSYHYLITTNGNTADGSYGIVSSAGDYIRIEPKSGYSATVTVKETGEEYYTESNGVFKLPGLTDKTYTRNIVVTFGEIDSNVDKSGYEAKIDGAYYDTLEEAVDAAKVQATEDVVTVTLLKDAEVEATMIIDDDTNIKVEGAEKYTINRADELVDGNIFNVKDGSTLTVDNVVLDGRTSSQIAAGTTDLNALTGSTQSLIYNAGTTNLQNMTGQYAVKTKEHGAVLQSGGADDIVTVANSTFRYNKSAGQGAALRMGGSTAKLEVANSVFEYNEVYTLTSTAEDGKVSVLFTGNGGAIGTHADVANIDNCTFVGNKATGYSANNDGSAGAVYSGTSSIVTLTGTDENALFSGNSVVNGAGGAVSAGSGKVTITGYTFESNTSTGNGGAIFSNGGSTKIKSVSCTFEGNTATSNGGVAYAGNAGTLIFDEDADCTVEALAKNNKAGGNGGATAQGKNTVVKVTGYKFEGNTAQHGGAIQANGDSLSTTVKNAEFVSNKTANLDGTDYAGTGGAIRNQTSAGEFIIVDSKFASNSAKRGGALYNSGVLTMTGTGSANALFDTNSSSDYGGAIYLDGTAVTITGYTFNGNTATATNGGAICNYSNGSQVLDCQFINNEAAQGGAVYCGGNTNTLTFGVTETPVQEAKFEGNESTGYGGAIGFGNGNLNVTGYSFANNKSATYGGAIYTVGDNNTINITDATFTNNNAANGGAVYAYGDKASTVVIGSTFTDNSATGNAGAVYVARTTATVTIDDSTFGTNSAVNGGALYNVGSLTVKNSALNNNTSTEYAGALFIDESTVTVENTSFTSNQSAEGGAIIVGRIEEVAATETTKATTNYYAGTLNATDCTFSTNKATTGKGGAVLNISGSTANITDTTFTSNESVDEGGAVNNAGALTLTGSGTTTATFNSNKNTGNSKNGGAIYNGGTLVATGYYFESNTATANGGAVCNYGKMPTFNDCQFTGNRGVNGAAVYSGGNQTVYLNENANPVIEAKFEGNIASGYGGGLALGTGKAYVTGYTFKSNQAKTGAAIHQNQADTSVALMEIKGTEFESNTTTDSGGAIYNKGPMKIVNAVFKGNSASQGGAIHNYSATTTIVNSKFESNASSTSGGAIANTNNGALSVLSVSEDLGVTTATQATFKGNTANNETFEYGGGAIYQGSGSFTVSGYTFEENQATASDGGAICTRTAATISGCTFNTNSAKNSGGAIWKQNTVPISECTFTSNTTEGNGGAVCSLYGTTTITDSSFTGNAATGEAGAVYVTEETLNATNTDFASNTAAVGGAISVGVVTVADETTTYKGGTLNVTDCNFTSNKATSGAGGAVQFISGTATLKSTDGSSFTSNQAEASNAGAIRAINGTVKITGYTFDQNVANDEGGAIYNTASLEATDCTFNGNKANSVTRLAAKATTNMGGGAIYNTDATMTVKTSVFTKNESASLGGAICNYNKASTITDCTFGGTDAEGNSLGNSAGTNGGAVYTGGGVTLTLKTDANSEMAFFEENSATSDGGAVAIGSGTLNITGYTFTGNHASRNGGATYITAGGTISQCTFDGNDADGSGGAYYTSKSPKVQSCVFKSNWADSQGGAVYTNGGTPTFTDCQFGGANTTDGNKAVNGGAFYQGGTASTVTFDVTANPTVDAIFQNNVSTATSGIGGGAIAAGNGYVTITGYEFKNNEAKGTGGAIHFNNSSHTNSITECIFDDNHSASHGGAVWTQAKKTTVTDCSFVRNDTKNSKTNGGAIFVSSNELQLYNDTTKSTVTAQFVDNKATQYGSAVYLRDDTSVSIDADGYTFTNNDALAAGAICMFSTGTLDNCTFTGNDATNGDGGAIYVTKQATFTNCSFETNTASKTGGAIWNSSTLTVTGGAFETNEATTQGGAICSGGSLTIENASFTSNSATFGGAIHTKGATVTLDNSTFTSNASVNATTSGKTGKGGGALNIVGDSNATITNSTFTTNSTDGWGGAIYTTDSKMQIAGTTFDGNTTTTHAAAIIFDNATENTLETETITVTDTKFVKNQGKNSGAMYINARTVTFTDCQFGGADASSGNKATSGNGGVIYVGANGTANFMDNPETSAVEAIMQNNSVTGNGGAIGFGKGATVTVDGYEFVSNTATGYGGAIYNGGGTLTVLNPNKLTSAVFDRNTSSTWGGAIYTSDGSLEVSDYTFDGNAAQAGGAILMFTASTITNTTFKNNNTNVTGGFEGGAIYVTKDTTFTDCKFEANAAATNGGAICMTSGTITFTNNSETSDVEALFQNNTATKLGGAIYHAGGTLVLNKGYVFANNYQATTTLNDIYLKVATNVVTNNDNVSYVEGKPEE